MMYRLEIHSLDTDEDGFFITDYVVINEAQYKDIMEIANQMIEFYEPAKDVIRCKDCKHWRQPNIIINGKSAWSGFCKHMDGVGDPEGFCYRAERRTND